VSKGCWPSNVGSVLFLIVAVVLIASGCGASRPKSGFDTQGYYNGPYGYRVVHAVDSKLDGNWLLDNFYMRRGRLEEKDGDSYLIEYALDTTGDGEGDRLEKLPVYDLRYKHKQRDAVIWLRTFPVSQELREKELRVLLQRYVEEVAGAGYEAVQLRANRYIVKENRYAAEILAEGPARLAGVEAYEATIEVANVDRLQLDRDRREIRVRLVLARPGFSYDVENRRQRKKIGFPVLLLAGYANLPGDFDGDLPAFESLLGQVMIGPGRGYEGPAAPSPAETSSAAPSEAEPPAAEGAPSTAEQPPEPNDAAGWKEGRPPSDVTPNESAAPARDPAAPNPGN
jgi:hypothetical protein